MSATLYWPEPDGQLTDDLHYPVGHWWTFRGNCIRATLKRMPGQVFTGRLAAGTVMLNAAFHTGDRVRAWRRRALGEGIVTRVAEDGVYVRWGTRPAPSRRMSPGELSKARSG